VNFVQERKRFAKSNLKKITTKNTQNKSNNKPILIFLLKFFGIFLVLEALITLIDLTRLTNFITTIVANFFNLPYLNNIIFVNSSTFVVTNSCTGLVSLAILAAITLPLKRMQLKKKVLVLGIGAFFLLTINIPRIGVVIYSGLIGFDAELVHELTWFLMSAIILLVWFFGIKYIQKEKDFSNLI
jgi:exosortase/archaeosortase family protein